MQGLQCPTRSNQQGSSNTSLATSMRKPTGKSRLWNSIHARRVTKRRLKSRSKYLAKKARQQAQRRLEVSRPTTRHGVTTKSSMLRIPCPSDFSLESNFEGVVGVLDRIRGQSRRQRNERTYIDFREIRTISPSAALVLAAELDRWNNELLVKIRKARLHAVDVEDWDPNVRRLLSDMGFFELLQVSWPQTEPANNGSSSRLSFVKFRTGHQVDGKEIDDLRSADLEPFVGVPNRYHLYAAVTEAMTNVVHHAYPSSAKPATPNWWLSASRNAESGECVIMIYDQGVGIPETLPRNFREQLRSLIPETLTKDHARMIEAAHELKRSSTRQVHRGHGLGRDIRNYVGIINRNSRYRVLSLRGEYIRDTDSRGRNTDIRRNHNRSLSGTLIEWKLTSEEL